MQPPCALGHRVLPTLRLGERRDVFLPSRITDFRLDNSSSDSLFVNLDWTKPRDDYTLGQAFRYESSPPSLPSESPVNYSYTALYRLLRLYLGLRLWGQGRAAVTPSHWGPDCDTVTQSH